MGYYCTVPQCTSLAGKTKNVKFHRFPRDVTMADKWNVILKRGKPYTKYSKVCSLHFTQTDYNVTTMGKNKGQWKTLSKDAVPSQNLPKLNPDGTVMVIRKSRTVKYKEGQSGKKEQESHISEKVSAWSVPIHTPVPAPAHIVDTDAEMQYRLNNVLTPNLSPENDNLNLSKPKKQDAIMQTDPVQTDEEETPTNTSEHSDNSYNSEKGLYYVKDPEIRENTNYEVPKDYTKSTEDYVPRTNEEYNKEAEKYALERKPNYEKIPEYQKPVDSFKTRDNYDKLPEIYQKDSFSEPYEQGYEKNDAFTETRQDPFIQYQSGFQSDPAELLRNQQHNLQVMQQHRLNENQTFFNENHIKQEIDLSTDDDKYLPYDRNKDPLSFTYNNQQRHNMMVAQEVVKSDYYEAQIKTEPEHRGCETAMAQDTPYYPPAGQTDNPGYYMNEMSRPGPELLIAKQNALAAHTQLWQNTMKRPFFYSESPHYNGSQLLHTRYEDITRLMNQ